MSRRKTAKRVRSLGVPSIDNTRQRDKSTDTALSFRALGVNSSSIDIANRTIECDASTENPVMMPDFSRGEMVPEILVTKGVVLPDSRQVPFLDSHQRGSVANQLGSARELQTKYNKLTAKLHFSSTADNEFTKVREGHVTDVSAGYQILKKAYVPAGETRSIMGKDYTGPVNVVTKWKPREVSLTPIGADDQAKLRGFDPSVFPFETEPQEREFVMDPELRKWLVTRGMLASLDDVAAQKWFVDNRERIQKEDIDNAVAAAVNKAKTEFAAAGTRTEQQSTTSTATAQTPISEERIAALVFEQTRKHFEQEQTRQLEYRTEVDANCDLAGLPQFKERCRSMASIQEVRTFLQAEKAKLSVTLPYSVGIRHTASGFEEMRADMGTALTLRALQGNGSEAGKERVFPIAQRGKNANHFRFASLYDMACTWVRAMGYDPLTTTREDVAKLAMFGPEMAGIRSMSGIGGPSYNTTGGFTALTLDAMNKSMMLGYVETPMTWRGPMRQGQSVADFKNINRIRMGAISNLPIWNDNSNPEKGTFADAKETYAVESRSLEIPFSYRLLVNDDMDALSRVPQMLGASAARTVNAVAWAQWTGNPTLQTDNVPLFSGVTGNRLRSNLQTGVFAPNVANLQVLTNNMRQMRGENVPAATGGAAQTESQDILNLQPKFIIGPGALETTILQLVNSIADPAANQAGVFNTARYLQPVIEPLLDVNSTSAWYLSADPNQIDTIEVSFLQGQEEPLTRDFVDPRTLSQIFIVTQTFAAKAMNHRGVQKANNA